MTPEQLAAILADNPDLAQANAQPARLPKAVPAPMPAASSLENEFIQLWGWLSGPIMEPEYRFHPTRRWRFDFAHVGSKVAIEVEGGTRTNGRHSRHAGFRGDCEKYNAAILHGWRVFRLTSDMIDADNLQPIIRFILE